MDKIDRLRMKRDMHLERAKKLQLRIDRLTGNNRKISFEQEPLELGS